MYHLYSVMPDGKLTDEQILATIHPIRTLVNGLSCARYVLGKPAGSRPNKLDLALAAVNKAIPKLSAQDLVGKTLQEWRRIKNMDPVPCNDSPNPRYMTAWLYTDGTVVLVEQIRLQDDLAQCWYYARDQEYKFTAKMFPG